MDQLKQHCLVNTLLDCQVQVSSFFPFKFSNHDKTNFFLNLAFVITLWVHWFPKFDILIVSILFQRFSR